MVNAPDPSAPNPLPPTPQVCNERFDLDQPRYNGKHEVYVVLGGSGTSVYSLRRLSTNSEVLGALS